MKNLNCPRPVKNQKANYQEPITFRPSVDLGIGVQQAFLAHNDGTLGEGYTFNSAPRPYVSVAFTQRILPGISVRAGLDFFTESVGLQFAYKTQVKEIIRRSGTNYKMGVLLCFHFSPSIMAGAGASLNSFLGFAEASTNHNMAGGEVVSYDSKWSEPGFPSRIAPMLDVMAAYKIGGRFSLEAQAWYNMAYSETTTGSARLHFSDGTVRNYSGHLKGKYLYAGLGLNVLLFR